MGSDLLPNMSNIVADDVIKETNQTYPNVADFFAHKTVAITGGTGFLGQGIIEKLLRCCPEVKKIILLIRRKRDQSPRERLQALAQLPAFDVLRETQPNFAEKLDSVCCDLQSEDLGLSEDSVQILKDEVNVFVHCAATLKFNEHMRISFEVNVQCIRWLTKLAREMVNLQAFVHISTAYSHCDRYEIEEQLYDSGIDYLDLEGSLRWMDDDLVTKVTPEILKKRPNTYTLTKAMAEDAIAREGNHLPICIVRPSMIIPAFKEPIPGWCTNRYGPTAFFVAYGKGVLRSVIADEGAVADLIPVDLVVNGVLASAMKTACDFASADRTMSDDERHRLGNCVINQEGDSNSPISRSCERHHVPIYHLTTGGHNPILIRELVEYGKEWYDQYPLNPLRLPLLSVTRNRFWHRTNLFVGQTFPAFLYDVYRILSNQRPVMLRLNDKLRAGMDVMEFFFTNDWKFDNRNTVALHRTLAHSDQKTFTTDARSFEWKENIKRYVMGTRRFLVKESMKEYPIARRMLKRWKVFNFCINLSIIAAMLGYTGLIKLIWTFLASLRRSIVNR